MTIEWPAPWTAPDPATSQALEDQLHKEVGTNHVLKDTRVRLIARRLDQDDALFALDDGRIAEVHLTWHQSPDLDPRWPRTAIFANFEEWCLTRDSN